MPSQGQYRPPSSLLNSSVSEGRAVTNASTLNLQKLIRTVALQLNCAVISPTKWPGDPDTCPSPGQRAPRSEQTHFPRNSGIFIAPGSFQANAGCFLSHLELKTPHHPASISLDMAAILASPSSTLHSRPAFSPLCQGSNPASLEALSSGPAHLVRASHAHHLGAAYHHAH